MRFINNQLVRHNFDVVNPFGGADTFSQAMSQVRDDSQKMSTDVGNMEKIGVALLDGDKLVCEGCEVSVRFVI